MLINQNEYLEIVETVKAEIRGAQYKAAVHVNREMFLLYYNIGQVINRHKTWETSSLTIWQTTSNSRSRMRPDILCEI